MENLNTLDTPALVIDLEVMENNIITMAEYCQSKNIHLRPHIKTHKTPEIAWKQLKAGAIGIAVAKLGEAEVMAEAGISDIFVANQVIGEIKLKRLANLAKNCRITVLADSEEGISALAQVAKENQVTIHVCLEINISDPDGKLGRCGIPYGHMEKITQLAKMVTQHPHLQFSGISAYRGVPSLFVNDSLELPQSHIAQTGLEEGAMVVDIANELRQRGFQVENVIGGSTPTAVHVAQIPGITEVHPGEYVFSGGTHVRTGVSSTQDCALSVVTTVISRPHPDRAIIDGGSKTFSGDIHPDLVPNLHLKGFGIISTLGGDFDNPEELPGAALVGLNEEHGMIKLSTKEARNISIGDRLRIIPNHICPVVNLFDRMYGVRNGIVEQIWEIKARGKVT